MPFNLMAYDRLQGIDFPRMRQYRLDRTKKLMEEDGVDLLVSWEPWNIRYITGGADCQSGGLKPFTKVGNWPLRDDFEDKKNPATLSELGAISNDLDAIYAIYPDVQDMWTYWLNQSPNK